MVKIQNVKVVAIGIIGTVVAVILELLLFPVMFTFLGGMNDTCANGFNHTSNRCMGDNAGNWITSTDRTLLANSSILTIIIILFTLIGGVIGSLYYGMKK